MKDITVFEHKNFSQLKGAFQNEIIRKVQRITDFSFDSIEQALAVKNPHIEYCYEYPELTRIKWYDTISLFSAMQKIEEKRLEKLKVAD